MIEQQANHHSFNLLFDDQDGEDILKEMDPNQQTEIRSAHADWLPIKEWLTKRKAALENARNIWDEFVSHSTDLVDYLNHTERESNTWKELDLNDDESMEEQKELLKVWYFFCFKYNCAYKGFEVFSSHMNPLPWTPL